MTVIAFRHMTGDGLGSLSRVFRHHEIPFEYLDTPHADLSGFDPLGPELLVVLGGSPGVYQQDIYPFLKDELRIIRARLAADRPTLGICLGSQLMAAALGAKVYPGPQGPEKGWHPITVNEAGKKTPVAHLDGAHTMLLHWHGDTFDMPEGATLLASSAQYKHQAIGVGKNCIGLQCHPEMTPRHIEDWLVSGAGDVARGTLDIAKVRAETAQYGQTLISQTAKFLTEYLVHTGVLKTAERKHA